jgi:hypothetical protein
MALFAAVVSVIVLTVARVGVAITPTIGLAVYGLVRAIGWFIGGFTAS